jgi:hypothetical protein
VVNGNVLKNVATDSGVFFGDDDGSFFFGLSGYDGKASVLRFVVGHLAPGVFFFVYTYIITRINIMATY